MSSRVSQTIALAVAVTAVAAQTAAASQPLTRFPRTSRPRNVVMRPNEENSILERDPAIAAPAVQILEDEDGSVSEQGRALLPAGGIAAQKKEEEGGAAAGEKMVFAAVSPIIGAAPLEKKDEQKDTKPNGPAVGEVADGDEGFFNIVGDAKADTEDVEEAAAAFGGDHPHPPPPPPPRPFSFGFRLPNKKGGEEVNEGPQHHHMMMGRDRRHWGGGFHGPARNKDTTGEKSESLSHVAMDMMDPEDAEEFKASKRAKKMAKRQQKKEKPSGSKSNSLSGVENFVDPEDAEALAEAQEAKKYMRKLKHGGGGGKKRRGEEQDGEERSRSPSYSPSLLSKISHAIGRLFGGGPSPSHSRRERELGDEGRRGADDEERGDDGQRRPRHHGRMRPAGDSDGAGDSPLAPLPPPALPLPFRDSRASHQRGSLAEFVRNRHRMRNGGERLSGPVDADANSAGSKGKWTPPNSNSKSNSDSNEYAMSEKVHVRPNAGVLADTDRIGNKPDPDVVFKKEGRLADKDRFAGDEKDVPVAVAAARKRRLADTDRIGNKPDPDVVFKKEGRQADKDRFAGEKKDVPVAVVEGANNAVGSSP